MVIGEVTSLEKESSPAPATGSPQTPAFSEDEWNALQNEDKKAGRAIISIMVGIFTLAFLLYTYIAFWATLGQ